MDQIPIFVNNRSDIENNPDTVATSLKSYQTTNPSNLVIRSKWAKICRSSAKTLAKEKESTMLSPLNLLVSQSMESKISTKMPQKWVTKTSKAGNSKSLLERPALAPNSIWARQLLLGSVNRNPSKSHVPYQKAIHTVRVRPLYPKWALALFYIIKTKTTKVRLKYPNRERGPK